MEAEHTISQKRAGGGASRAKLLFVITKSNWGGAQRYVYDLSVAFRDTFDVRVACGQEGPLVTKLQEAGITTYPIRPLQRDVSFINDVRSFFELFHLFRAERPDVVHLNSSKAGGVGALAARFARVPKIVFTAHGWPFGEQRNIFSRALLYFFSWCTALLSHTVIVVCDHDLKMAQKMPFVGRKTIHVYNGIHPQIPFGSGETIRRAFPKGVRITGTIGELNKNKNQIALIEQAKNDPDLYVAIVGDGENRVYLQKQIEAYGLTDRVKLFGFRPAHEVLRGFDVFALPSLKEGLPYVLLEAKMAGLPIIANRVGGVGEILDAKDMSEFSLEQMVQKTLEAYH